MLFYPVWLPVEGVTLHPSLTLIKRCCKEDRALHAHAHTHALQMRIVGLPTFWWRYLTDRKFRQMVEVEAYRAQIRAGASMSLCASALAHNYYLCISFQRAWDLLK